MPTKATRAGSAPANSSREHALTREQIVDAAVAWTDREGLDSFSMRRFAASLDISGPALYWHFRSRDDLLRAAAEQVLRRVDSSVGHDEPWDTSVRRMLESVWRAAREHPGLLAILRTQPLHIGAGQRLVQSLLVALRRAGFEPEAAVDHTRALLWTTFGFIRGTAATLERVDGPPDRRVVEVELDRSALDMSTWPTIEACMPRLETLDIDALFRHTVDTMIAGIASRPPRDRGGVSEPSG